MAWTMGHPRVTDLPVELISGCRNTFGLSAAKWNEVKGRPSTVTSTWSPARVSFTWVAAVRAKIKTHIRVRMPTEYYGVLHWANEEMEGRGSGPIAGGSGFRSDSDLAGRRRRPRRVEAALQPGRVIASSADAGFTHLKSMSARRDRDPR